LLALNRSLTEIRFSHGPVVVVAAVVVVVVVEVVVVVVVGGTLVVVVGTVELVGGGVVVVVAADEVVVELLVVPEFVHQRSSFAPTDLLDPSSAVAAMSGQESPFRSMGTTWLAAGQNGMTVCTAHDAVGSPRFWNQTIWLPGAQAEATTSTCPSLSKSAAAASKA
jgi:hypothetical protein